VNKNKKKYILRLLLLLLPTLNCFAQQPVHAITPVQVDTIVDGVIRSVGDYVFSEIAVKLQAYLRYHRAEYRAISDPKVLANRLTEDLRAEGHDHHLQVIFGEELGIQKEPTPEEKQHAHSFDRANGYGIRSVRRLPGNIGYVDLAYFSPDEDAGAALAAAMQLVTGTDALILDLRRNGGGSGETATALLSYFFEEPKQLSSIVERKNGHLEERQKWTMPYVAGPRYIGKPLYVLISSHTHSAAELCAYDMKAMRRATIIGAKSSGDANSSKGVIALGYGFAVFVPNGQTKSPITLANWEGEGVQPDVPVTADALLVAYERVLKEAKASVTDSDELKDERQKAVKNPQAALNQEVNGFQ
jgi:Peptidase family S41/N-terminal domain of Peptidase_S41 in eukaryotic IRBP